MTVNVIETEKLTKSHGSHRGIIEVDLDPIRPTSTTSCARGPSLEETLHARYGRQAAEVK